MFSYDQISLSPFSRSLSPPSGNLSFMNRIEKQKKRGMIEEQVIYRVYVGAASMNLTIVPRSLTTFFSASR